ncbi:hypothetical protein SLS63_011282 [Diaporthe eres]|uniref:Uncharacterized protein n=1 Tax=Diaporthe eres TaxID=83184 RepID=A0ABR1NUG1_DIAER
MALYTFDNTSKSGHSILISLRELKIGILIDTAIQDDAAADVAVVIHINVVVSIAAKGVVFGVMVAFMVDFLGHVWIYFFIHVAFHAVVNMAIDIAVSNMVVAGSDVIIDSGDTWFFAF